MHHPTVLVEVFNCASEPLEFSPKAVDFSLDRGNRFKGSSKELLEIAQSKGENEAKALDASMFGIGIFTYFGCYGLNNVWMPRAGYFQQAFVFL